MQELDVNPKVTQWGDTILIDLIPGMTLRLSVESSLKLLADLNRCTQRAMMHVEQDEIQIDIEFDQECTTPAWRR
jgi:hypothetical protein